MALAALLAVYAGCGAPSSPARATPGAAETVWRPLGAWSGRGNIQTESFDVVSGALRLTWETHGESGPGAGTFRVALHSAISGRPLQTFVERQGVGRGTAYLEDDPRVSYLVIESDRVEWRITLEEAGQR